MTGTALLTILAGALTAFAPCILPLLPVILGGSVAQQKSKWRPYVIIASLIVSLIVFTYLLKVSTALIGVDPIVWKMISGGIVIVLGVFMLFPLLWARIIGMLGIEHRSQELLAKGMRARGQLASAILTGAALGPVFSSCSPTYAWLVATVIPTDAVTGSFYLVLYCLGLAAVLLVIALLGRRIIKKFKWATKPTGVFQRTIAILFILVGVAVITGLDKAAQTYLNDIDIFNLKQVERSISPGESL